MFVSGWLSGSLSHLQGQRESGQALEQEALDHVLPARPLPKEEPGLTGVGILGNE